jgi:hypothetical protein
MNPVIQLWAGRVLTALPVLMLTMSGVMKLMGGPELAKGFEHLGWPMDRAVPLGVLELAITIVYLFPRTAVIGAILLTGYLGGAMAAHIRIHEDWLIQFLLGVMLWGGLYFRDERIRALIPLRGN